MDTFADYYAVLGLKPDASTDAIKAAFKKLALQYHPDVYKGEDAEERMRILLTAYQTLSNPAARKAYDARRSEHFLDGAAYHAPLSPGAGRGAQPTRPGSSDISPTARRDRRRHYAFPDLSDGSPARIKLGEIVYDLSPGEALMLRRDGMLRGVALEASGKFSADTLEHLPHYCHRCHHRWTPASLNKKEHDASSIRMVCPACKADDWGEYLLLCCSHCRAVFESEQIRYEIGAYNYGDRSLCPPYELFPLCPYCGTSGWCPAEEVRLSTERAVARRRARMIGLVFLSIMLLLALVLAVVLVNALR